MRIILRKTVNTAENSALELVNLPSSKVIRLTQPSVHVKFEEFMALHVSSFFFNKSISNLAILLYIFRRLSVQTGVYSFWCKITNVACIQRAGNVMIYVVYMYLKKAHRFKIKVNLK